MLRNRTAGTTTKRRTQFTTSMLPFCSIAVHNRFELDTCSHIIPILAGRNTQEDEVKGKYKHKVFHWEQM